MRTTCSVSQSMLAALVTMLFAMIQPSRAGDSDIQSEALPSAHAHNDYEHPHPLFDALAQGFNSVEADIWLVSGQLLVAHDREQARPERTLQALYLDPLRERIGRNGGRVFTNTASFTLMIDVKSEAEPTYLALRAALLGYSNILASFTTSTVQTNSLNIWLTGNRALEMVAAEPLRYVAIDGRLADMKTNLSPQLVPLISENWMQHFKWRGHDAFPDSERSQLRQLVERVHQQGRRLRFWAAPDTFAGWRELQSAGVDVIGTDDLVGLAKFLNPTKR